MIILDEFSEYMSSYLIKLMLFNLKPKILSLYNVNICIF